MDKKLLTVKINSTINTIQRMSPGEKENHVPTVNAEEFNSLLDTIEADFPQLEGLVPARLSCMGAAAHMMGKSDVTYSDYLVALNQLTAMLEAIE